MTGSFDVSSLPLVLAGPILRRVDPPSSKSSDGTDSTSDRADPASVTVWVALSEAWTVNLTVFKDDESDESDGEPLLTSDTENPVEPVQLGENLHVVAVTADTRVDGADELAPGTVYSYDLEFTDGNTTKSLAGSDVLEGGIGSITYGDQLRPTFSLPPPDLDNLRIVHTSCRKPHDPLPDALPAVNEMIHWTATDANARPHQLFLTGDQIYADDIADALLAHIDHVAPALLGRPESFQTSDGEKKIADMPPGSRDTIAEEECGFTSGHKRSHLFGIGEYYVMYLLNWSEVLWPDELPAPKEVLPDEHETAMRYIKEFQQESGFREVRGWVTQQGVLDSIMSRLFETKRITDLEKFSDAVEELQRYTEAREGVKSFENNLPNVRKALANVPTYMIFDDHDVTDDWFLRGKWTKGVVGKKMGRQVLQNAMVAYAVCQGWGNTPERFESGNGRELLNKLEIKAADGDGATGQDDEGEAGPIIDRSGLNDLLGIPSTSDDESQLEWPSDPIDWHYTVQGTSDGERTAHEVLVLDTRTQRGFLKNGDPPELIRTDTDAFESQLPEQTTKAEVTVVVSAVPVWIVPIAASIKESILARALKEYPERDPEHWHQQHQAQERLIAQLATRASESDERSRSRVVLLSGDVHHSYSSRMQYWAERPFEVGDAEQTELVIASLTASGAKNTSPSVNVILHYLGYQAIWILGLLVAYPLAKFIEGMPEEIVFGWNEEPPQFPESTTPVRAVGQQPVQPMFRHHTKRNPPLVTSAGSIGDEYDLGSAPEPDWRYRVDFVDSETYAGDGSDAPSPSGDIPPLDEIEIPQHGGPGTDPRNTALGEYLEHADWWSNVTYHESAGPSDREGEWGFGSEIVVVNSVGEVAFEWEQEETGETEGKRVIHALWWRLDGENGALPPFPLSKYVVSLDYDDDAHPRPQVITDS